ncbi:MAG: ABC transporter ATP-binding protein [Deltaproteobacteria bacterium]|nr:ABC transporter ATP-binding protein [Deltaproteobacteria bacterium]
MNAVEAKSLSKVYRLYPNPRQLLVEYLTFRRRRTHAEFWALKDITFSVPRGGVFGLIGDNGAGKSTLLRVLAGATQPTSGTLVVESPSASLIDLGTGFKPDFTGRDNVRLNCALLGFNARQTEEALQDIVAFSELGKFIDYPLQTYSSGMIMRLGFAVAASVPSRVIFIDEVIAVGDNYFQHKCIDRLSALQRDGRTIVFATHNLHAVKTMCHQVMWLKSGVCEALGPAEDVVARYSDYTRARDGCAAEEQHAVTHQSRHVSVLGVRVVGADGREAAEFETGQRVAVEVDFRADAPVVDPAFGVAIHRNDGVYCFGPNTAWDKVLYGEYCGDYRLSITYPALPLLAGSYLVSVGIFDREHVVPYVYHDRMYGFAVRTSRPEYGMVLIEHEWGIRKL